MTVLVRNKKHFFFFHFSVELHEKIVIVHDIKLRYKNRSNKTMGCIAIFCDQWKGFYIKRRKQEGIKNLDLIFKNRFDFCVQ